MGILDKLFGTRSEREVKRLLPAVDKIEALSDEYAALSDEALRAKTETPMPAWDQLRREMPQWRTLLLRTAENK